MAGRPPAAPTPSDARNRQWIAMIVTSGHGGLLSVRKAGRGTKKRQNEKNSEAREGDNGWTPVFLFKRSTPAKRAKERASVVACQDLGKKEASEPPSILLADVTTLSSESADSVSSSVRFPPSCFFVPPLGPLGPLFRSPILAEVADHQ